MSSDSESDYSYSSDEEEFTEDSSECSGSEVESDEDLYYSFPPAKQPKLTSGSIIEEWLWKDTDNEPQIKQFTASPGSSSFGK